MRNLWAATLLSATFASFVPLAANAATVSFTSILTGVQENPDVDTPAIGTATGTLSSNDAGGNSVFTYQIDYSGLTGAIARPFAHIHIGAIGVNGPIIHDLDNASSFAGTTSGTITGDWRFDDATKPLTDAFAQELANGNLYFNIHTTAFPTGEIRGQIQAVPEPSSTLGVLALVGLGAAVQLKRTKKANLFVK